MPPSPTPLWIAHFCPVLPCTYFTTKCHKYNDFKCFERSLNVKEMQIFLTCKNHSNYKSMDFITDTTNKSGQDCYTLICEQCQARAYWQHWWQMLLMPALLLYYKPWCFLKLRPSDHSTVLYLPCPNFRHLWVPIHQGSTL